jgi:hypothetical protein
MPHEEEFAIVRGLVPIAWADGSFAEKDKEMLEALLDASGAPQVESPDMEAVFRRYVGLIDSMRQIDRALAQGPLGGGSGPGGEDDSTKK